MAIFLLILLMGSTTAGSFPRRYFCGGFAEQPVCQQCLLNSLDEQCPQDISIYRTEEECERFCDAERTPPGPLCDVKADLVFLLDSSVPAETFSLMKLGIANFLKSRLANFERSRFAVVQMTGAVPTTHFGFRDHTTVDAVVDAVERIPHIGGEHLGEEALRFVDQKIFQPFKGDRPGVTDLVVYIAGTPSRTNMQEQARIMKQKGIWMTAIGLALEGASGETARHQLKKLVGGDPRLFTEVDEDDFESPNFNLDLTQFGCIINEI